jgi:hypothetical protein
MQTIKTIINLPSNSLEITENNVKLTKKFEDSPPTYEEAVKDLNDKIMEKSPAKEM